MKKITITSLTASALAFPVISMAATPVEVREAGTISGSGESAVRSLTAILDRIGTWALILLGALATFYIILAAFNFVTAKGDTKKIGDARQEITYALVAIVVGAVAKLLTSIVGGIAGGIQ